MSILLIVNRSVTSVLFYTLLKCAWIFIVQSFVTENLFRSGQILGMFVVYVFVLYCAVLLTCVDTFQNPASTQFERGMLTVHDITVCVIVM